MPAKSNPEPRLLPFTERLRERVLTARNRRTLTDLEISTEMGISRPAVTNFMRGKNGTGINYEHGKRLEGFLSDEDV